MEICHITTVHPLHDIRIYHKQCKSLVEAGYDVSLIVTHDRDETIEGIHIIGLKKRSGRWARMFVGTFEALRRAIRQNASVYHFHDPELIPVGIALKMLGKKVIYDVHENTSEQILSKAYLGSRFTRKLISTVINLVEKVCTLVFDVIIVVSPDIARHWNSRKVQIILNAAVLKNIDNARTIEINKPKPVIIYAGNLSVIRGIPNIIETVGLLEGKAELWLMGAWMDEGLQRDCEKLAGWQYVKYFGYLPVDEVYGYMKKSDIGVVTFLPLPNQVASFPNKPLEYMSCRLPVIMSDFEFWKQTYKDNVLYVDPESPMDIKNKIELLLDDPALRSTLGNRGRKLVEDNFSWESESKKLLSIYKSLDTAI